MLDSTTDSTRNWRRISRGRAPSAMRMPISRVRSVTETSMMFMMPTPPTTKEMAAMAESIPVKAPVMTLNTLAISAVLRISKSGFAAVGNAMAFEEKSPDLFLGERRHGLASCRNEHKADVRKRRTFQPLAHRGVRHQQNVVLILSNQVRPFVREHADRPRTEYSSRGSVGPADLRCRTAW